MAVLVIAVFWGVSSLLLGVTGAGRKIAAAMGRPDAWQCVVAASLLGMMVLAMATWVRPERQP